MDLEQQLLDEGHEVTGIAATAVEAVEVARTMGGDLALMDVSLADGSSGVDAARVLKESFGIPSIYITATLPDAPEVRSYGLGHLSKPFDENDLLSTVRFIQANMRGDTNGRLPAKFRLFS